MPELLSKERNRSGRLCYTYKCDVCGKPTSRMKVCKRVVCFQCSRSLNRRCNEKNVEAVRQDGYIRGWNEALEAVISRFNGNTHKSTLEAENSQDEAITKLRLVEIAKQLMKYDNE